MLQIDLKDAFDSIKPAAFNSFIKGIGADGAAVQMLEVMLKSFSKVSPGFPFLNDSLFFLGNAYLKEVDTIVARRTSDFIRFVDDYKIFGDSIPDLEAKFASIRADLREIGFEINENKLWLGSGQEYLQLLADRKYAPEPRTDSGE